MSDSCNDITKDLQRGGLDQAERTSTSLNPDQLKLMEFGIKDWMQFAYNFSKNVLFYSTSNDKIPFGNWEAFFQKKADLEDLLEEYPENDKLTPHLTLFICFLKLLELSKNRFNQITKRHLDFYYEDILQIAKMEEEADKVYLLFELAKNIGEAKIPEGSEFDGGKDDIGKKRYYVLKEQFIANKSTITSFKSIYNTPQNNGGFISPIKASPVADSADGMGKEIKNEPKAWFPFGYDNTFAEGFENTPNAHIGFAVSGHSLLLSEGKRFIVFIIKYEKNLPAFNWPDLDNNIHFSYTTEEGWTDLAKLSEYNEKIDKKTFVTRINDNELSLFIELTDDAPASFNYDSAIHGQHFQSSSPVFKFIISTDNERGYDLYQALTAKIESIDIKLKVKGIRTVHIESDTGTLNPDKPFYPFTTLPAIGSNFEISNSEIFSKKWTSVDVSIKWQNTPANFNEHYRAYDKSFAVNTSKSWLKQIIGAEGKINEVKSPAALKSKYVQPDTSSDDKTKLIATNPDNTISTNPESQFLAHSFGAGLPAMEIEKFQRMLEYTTYNDLYNSIVTGDNYFEAKLYLEENKEWDFKNDVTLFRKKQDSFYTEFNVPAPVNKQTESIRLSLKNDFLHTLYPTIYTLALASEDEEVLIPNQPYTPFAEYIELDYEAEETLDLLSETYPNSKIKPLHLYHITPFGEREEHLYLGGNTTFIHISKTICTLLPKYGIGGELFIGIRDAKPLQELSILFQFLEGSENPLTTLNSSQTTIEWAVLCSNYWKTLDTSSLLADPTENFLQSGIVKLILPEEATDTNTLLSPGLFWIRIKTRGTYDAFCKVIGISAQAAQAEFDNRENDIAHLLTGIPADTITKMVNRSVYVKTVEQPYNSFGGRLSETQEEYYRRVSERLRHKNRAVNLWDYEHLVLQKFPEIFKVKCLNHTCDCSFLSGGNVTIVTLPNTRKKNVFDSFQPRVSTALLIQIADYLSQLNSLHVKTHVINPDYEEVRVSLQVKFKRGYDAPYHLNEINKDIQKYLSPWAFEDIQSLNFGVILFRSELIDYIDELPYVDYVTHVDISHNGKNNLRQCEPSSPKAILVSAKSHIITPITDECKQVVNQTEETC